MASKDLPDTKAQARMEAKMPPKAAARMDAKEKKAAAAKSRARGRGKK